MSSTYKSSNTLAAEGILQVSTSEKVLKNLGWGVYSIAFLTFYYLMYQQMANPEKQNQYYVYYIIFTILSLAVLIAYGITYFYKKEINMYFNYVALIPIVIIVIFFLYASAK
jgi:hypothetical protein